MLRAIAPEGVALAAHGKKAASMRRERSRAWGWSRYVPRRRRMKVFKYSL